MTFSKKSIIKKIIKISKIVRNGIVLVIKEQMTSTISF